MKGFIEFIRKQGVIGLAVGFILGGAISKVIASLVSDIVNPVIGVVFGMTGDLPEAALRIGPIKILWGHFAATMIDFLVIAFVIYFGVKGFGLDKLDKKEEK